MAKEPDGSPGKICTHKGCQQTKGLSKTKAGNWYCGAHHPIKKARHKAGSAKGGKRAGQTKRENRDAELLTLDIQPNKASILAALVQQANFLAKDMGPRELRRHRMVVELLDRIHDHATDEGDDAKKEAKVVAILESTLPDEIKLGKLVDVVGPARACELVKIEIVRDDYEKETLDGEQLLREGGKGGVASITKPENFEVSESIEGDVPGVDLEAPTFDELQAGATPVDGTIPIPAPGADPVAVPPAAAATPPPQAPQAPPGHDKESLGQRQSRELMGLYRVKVRGNFTDLDKVTKTFYAALMEGVPFESLRQRVMFPKSDTDQATMMVSDVKAAIAKRKGAG